MYLNGFIGLCNQNVTFDEKLFQNEVFTTVEQPFTFDQTSFPAVPIGTMLFSIFMYYFTAVYFQKYLC